MTDKDQKPEFFREVSSPDINKSETADLSTERDFEFNGRETTGEATDAEAASVKPVTDTDVPEPAGPVKSPDLKAIEDILADGLDDFFKALAPAQQLEFKQQGENTALKIQEVLERGRYRIKDIVNLIIQWLKNLPGVNKFFLRQEAKIKADKIVQRYNHK